MVETRGWTGRDVRSDAPPLDDNCTTRLRRRNIFAAADAANDDNGDATARLNIHKVAR